MASMSCLRKTGTLSDRLGTVGMSQAGVSQNRKDDSKLGSISGSPYLGQLLDSFGWNVSSLCFASEVMQAVQ